MKVVNIDGRTMTKDEIISKIREAMESGDNVLVQLTGPDLQTLAKERREHGVQEES